MMPALLALVVWLGKGLRKPGARHVSRRGWGVALTGLVLVVAWQWPTIQHRTSTAVKEFADFKTPAVATSASDTSVGLRLALWHRAFQLGWSHPMTGWGEDGYKQEKQRRIDRGEAPSGLSALGHAHNDWLEMWAKKGLPGLIAFALLMAIPAISYWRVLREPSTSQDTVDRSPRRAVALCGLTLVVGYVGFGQTQVMFAHNSGIMMYLFMNLLFLSACVRLPGLEKATDQQLLTRRTASGDVSDDVTLCMTMGNRPDLLDTTLRSLLAFHSFIDPANNS
jgi:O-antigen ligase